MTVLKVMVMEPDRYYRTGVLTLLQAYPHCFQVVCVADSFLALRRWQIEHREYKADLLLSSPCGCGETLDAFFMFQDFFFRLQRQTTWLMWSNGLEHILPGLLPQRPLPVTISKKISPRALLALLLLRHRHGHARFTADYRRTQIGAVCHLTQKELLILNALAQGESAKQLARRIGRSEKTISAHKATALRKLGVRGDRRMLQFRHENMLLSILHQMGREKTRW